MNIHSIKHDTLILSKPLHLVQKHLKIRECSNPRLHVSNNWDITSTIISHKPLEFNKCIQNEHLKSNCPSLFSVNGLINKPQNLTEILTAPPLSFIPHKDPLFYSHSH